MVYSFKWSVAAFDENQPEYGEVLRHAAKLSGGGAPHWGQCTLHTAACKPHPSGKQEETAIRFVFEHNPDTM